MRTHWGIWLKRPRRSGQRPNPKYWGWLLKEAAERGVVGADPHSVPTEENHGYPTHGEAENAAFVLAARCPWIVGWVELRLFRGYRDHNGNWVFQGS